MTCHRRFTLEDALNEVEHLNHLRHTHIVQLVGTYAQGRSFAILFYPVADRNLKVFMQNLAHAASHKYDWKDVTYSREVLQGSLANFFHCLISALDYIHQHTTRHMDIKPLNILVRAPGSLFQRCIIYHRVYIADFVISSSFIEDHSQSEIPRARTVRYCAPEIFNYEARGRASAVFSLRCIFSEMCTVLAYEDLDEFAQARAGDESEDESFHANSPRVFQWVEKLPEIPRVSLFG